MSHTVSSSSEFVENQPDSLPRRITVSEIVSSRYQPGSRPVSWDERHPGIEQIKTTDGELIKLYSSGGQSSPAPGWQLLLTEQEPSEDAITWTLYGVS